MKLLHKKGSQNKKNNDLNMSHGRSDNEPSIKDLAVNLIGNKKAIVTQDIRDLVDREFQSK